MNATPKPVQSMTGFGSASVQTDEFTLRVDLRSVNGKGFDLRLRLPQGLDEIEGELKKRVAAHIARGNVQLAATIDLAASGSGVSIDAELFHAMARQAKALSIEAGLAPPTTDAILALRGVVVAQPDVGSKLDVDDLRTALIEASQKALEDLVRVRVDEGIAIANVMRNHIDAIEQLVASASGDPATRAETIALRIKQQLARLISDDDPSLSIDPQRLHAEAAMLATKADITEELDRLTAHISAARTLFAAGGAIGRKLEFLCQEFNREANTLCAKASSTTLTQIGLDMKSAIDQMREQSANLE